MKKRKFIKIITLGLLSLLVPFQTFAKEIKKFIKMLKDKYVTLFVDVRESPTSWRHKQFNREELAASCRKAGVAYQYCGELGNRGNKPIAKLIETQEGQQAVADLAISYDESGEKATAIMCAEREREP